MNRYTWVKKNYGMGGFVWSPHAHGIVYGRFENVTKGSDLYRYRNIRRVNSLRACEGIFEVPPLAHCGPAGPCESVSLFRHLFPTETEARMVW